jgi:hypothetical protein
MILAACGGRRVGCKNREPNRAVWTWCFFAGPLKREAMVFLRSVPLGEIPKYAKQTFAEL